MAEILGPAASLGQRLFRKAQWGAEPLFSREGANGGGEVAGVTASKPMQDSVSHCRRISRSMSAEVCAVDFAHGQAANVMHAMLDSPSTQITDPAWR